MTRNTENSRGGGAFKSFLRRPVGLTLCAALLVGGVLLVFALRGEIPSGAAFLLLPVLCLLMHLFMHRGHGGHRQGEAERDDR